MVGIEGVPEPEQIGEKRRAEQHRVGRQRNEGPGPRGDICDDQQAEDRGETMAHRAGTIIERICKGHRVSEMRARQGRRVSPAARL